MLNSKLNVVLCYLPADKKTAHGLYYKLKDIGWMKVWSSDEDMLLGQDLNLEIENAVRSAQVVIVCVSKTWKTEEGNFHRALNLALDVALSKPPGSIFIIPLKLEDCDLPAKLHHLVSDNYFEDREKAHLHLFRSLRERAKEFEISTSSENLGVKDQPTHSVVSEPRELVKPTPKVNADDRNSGDLRKNVTPPEKAKPRSFAFAITIFILSVTVVVLTLASFIFWKEASGGATEVATATSALSTPIATITTEAQIPSKDNMVIISAGAFKMGSDANDDEKPIHSVSLNEFWIDKTETTNAMYAQCVQAGKCGTLSNETHFNDSNYINHPVVYVSWNNAKDYCEYVGKRLPTEAEWEKAARGTGIYPWGNELPNADLLNYNNNIGNTKAVGSYPNGVSPYGALDMAGNVWEWVSSVYKSYPYDALDGREDLTSSDPRVVRGGSWNSSADFVRSSDRFMYTPSISLDYLGFRCASSQ